MKTKKIFFFIIFLFISFNFFFTYIGRAVQISENELFYIVKNVKIENLISTNIDNIKQVALNQIKRKALEELLLKLGHDDIILTDANLDSCINGYKIIDEYYNNEYYSIMANFDFNKSIIQDYIQNNTDTNKTNKTNHSKLVNAIVILNENYNIVNEYITFKNWLIKNKISYKPLQIKKQQISIKLLNVYEDTIYKTLKKLNLNGSIYLE